MSYLTLQDATTVNAFASSPRLWALIACGGHGSRFGSAMPKQYTLLLGQPLVLHTLQAFAAVPRLSKVLVAVAPGDDALDELRGSNIAVAHCGGATRAQTVLNGLGYLKDDLSASEEDWVLVHDAARCLITPAEIDRLIDACQDDAVGGLLALPLADTLKRAEDGRARTTVSRQDLWLAQTPQMFRLGALRQALQQQGDQVTDEASAIEAQGLQPKLVASQTHNLKVTYPQDLQLAEAVMRKLDAAPHWRIGEGWDTHALVPDRPLMLGGVHVPYHLGLLGHSDADVLLHAITDALLGAASLGDIGSHFSDTDAQYKNADSWLLLQRTGQLLSDAGWAIGNIDSTIIAQAPKLAPHISAMRTRVAQALNLNVEQVNVKAKTAEKMGPVGLGQSMEARAVAMVYRA